MGNSLRIQASITSCRCNLGSHCFHSVSIQLVSPASGETGGANQKHGPRRVSIQLVSPASGEVVSFGVLPSLMVCFHSISFPSEWGESYFKPLPSKISRADFRSSDNLQTKTSQFLQTKSLKPLCTKQPKFTAVVTDGEKVSKYDNPKHIAKHEKNLKRKQKKLARKVKGSNSRNKYRKIVAKVYERVSNSRQDFLHKLSYKLVS